MTETADIVVVGGGAMGASIAYHLTAAGAGPVGLLEMVHVWSSAATGRTRLRIFWTSVDVARAAPWLVFAALAVGGVLALRRVAPRAAAAFGEATDRGQGAAR